MSISISNIRIGQDCEPFIIAEMSGNHNQSLEKAIEIVRAAKRTGASAIKLQTYKPETLTINVKNPDFLVDDNDSLWKGSYLFELYENAYTPWEWHEAIFNEAKSLGLVYFSSAFDESSVDFLETLDVPAYKIASFENSHLPLVKKIAATGKPVIVSTGMATLEEIEETISTLRENGCTEFILLKCTSNYPANPKSANLETIKDLRGRFGCEVGLSDHTLGVGVSVAAIAMGASVIEKHLTLTSADSGVDADFSMSEEQMKNLVEECNNAWLAKGRISYGPTEEEIPSLKFRRSIYAISDIAVGDELTISNIGVIRPGFGLHPRNFEKLIGKTSSLNLQKGERVTPGIVDLE
jgi:N-acetylneuraminate synthase